MCGLDWGVFVVFSIIWLDVWSGLVGWRWWSVWWAGGGLVGVGGGLGGLGGLGGRRGGLGGGPALDGWAVVVDWAGVLLGVRGVARLRSMPGLSSVSVVILTLTQCYTVSSSDDYGTRSSISNSDTDDVTQYAVNK
mgnify:CR=1 FL=1